jgi:site-specific recombinase XerD
MPPTPSQKQQLSTLSRIRRVRGQPEDPYELIFLDQQDHIIVPLTEWYRLRTEQGPASTGNTYLACLMPFFTFLADDGCPWNAPPERLRRALIAFHRDRLGCQIHPRPGLDAVEITLTRETPLQESTLRVMRAALRDFYLVMKEAGLYAFANPLSSEVLVTLKREQTRALANRGAPDHAGVREETHEQSQRRPTAFIRHRNAQGWQPEVRKELADVRQGMHEVLDALLDSQQVGAREKAVLELLQTTGARIHEVVLMTVGSYQNQGIAGQARVVNKGSYGREIKTIYFAHNPKVQQALNVYLEQMRPLHDPHGRTRLAEVGQEEPLFLTSRKTPYSLKDFYWHWYRHYMPLRDRCPVRFSPHDLRHLFVTEYLIKLKLACGAGTEHFDSEKYLREREAFGSMIMAWRSARTIDIYDQSREGEAVFSVLAGYQQDLSQRRYVEGQPRAMNPAVQGGTSAVPPQREELPPNQGTPIVWMHDAETLDWIKSMEQQAGQQS